MRRGNGSKVDILDFVIGGTDDCMMLLMNEPGWLGHRGFIKKMLEVRRLGEDGPGRGREEGCAGWDCVRRARVRVRVERPVEVVSPTHYGSILL